jgi:hypothetical protein
MTDWSSSADSSSSTDTISTSTNSSITDPNPVQIMRPSIQFGD